MTENLNTKIGEQAGVLSRRVARTRGTVFYRLLALAEICILVGVIVLFNVFPEKIGIYSSAVEPYLFVPLLTPAWLPFMPWLNLWLGLALTVALVKLVYSRWTQALRWADLAVHLLSICLLAGVLWGYSFSSPSEVHQHAALLLVGFKWGLVLVLVAQVVGLFTKLTKLGITVPVLQLRLDSFRR